MNRIGNFGLVLQWKEILLTYIHNFRIQLDFLCIKDLKKNEKKAQNFFKGHTQGKGSIY